MSRGARRSDAGFSGENDRYPARYGGVTNQNEVTTRYLIVSYAAQRVALMTMQSQRSAKPGGRSAWARGKAVGAIELTVRALVHLRDKLIKS